MKKVLLFVFASILCSCSDTSSPEATVKSYINDGISITESFEIPKNYQDLKNLDPKLLQRCVELTKYFEFGENVVPTEKEREQFGSMLLLGLGVTMPASVEITDTKQVDDKRARVYYTITQRDGRTSPKDCWVIKTDDGWRISLK